MSDNSQLVSFTSHSLYKFKKIHNTFYETVKIVP